MNTQTTPYKADILNNRILVKNTHKYVLKKINSANKDSWCQRYMSVAASKLSNPVLTHKLPVSLSKRFKTQATVIEINK